MLFLKILFCIQYADLPLIILLEIYMPLLVKYANDGTGYVPTYELNSLLTSGKIEAFQRSNGQWIDPKVDPVRGQGSPCAYSGPNRRARWQ
jgi:hypothetical protein